MVGHEFGLRQVRGALQSYGKRVQAGPVGLGLRVVLNTHLRVFLGNGRDDRRVETAREQHTVGHITHQLTLDGSLQRIVDGFDTGGIVLHGVVLHPIATIVPFHSWVYTPIVVSGQEGLIALALAFEGFQFGGDIHGAVAVISNIKRYHADGVAGNQELVALFIVEHESEDTTEVFEEVNALLTIQSQDNLTVGARLKLVLSGKAATDLLMVVNLTIHGQDLFTVGRIEGLST